MAVTLQPAVAEFTVELHPDNDVRIVNEGPLPGENFEAEVTGDLPLSNRIAALSVSFPVGSPAVYALDSERDIDLIVDGFLPGGATATATARPVGSSVLVDDFSVELGEDAWSIPAEALAKLPQGRIELSVVLTAPGLRDVEIAQEYLFLPPGLDAEILETWYDPPTVEEIEQELSSVPDFVPVPGQGLVKYQPAPGGQIYYVAEAGSDSNSGLSPEDPLRTLRSAYERVGDKDGDTILLKAGDTFQDGIGGFTKSGKSPEEPLLIGVYGEGDRPIIHTNGGGFLTSGGIVSNVVIDGLYIYANRHSAKEDGIHWDAAGKNITFQDLKIEGFGGNLSIEAPSKGATRNVTIRRCILVGAYKNYKDGHSSGMYLENLSGVVIDECVFDHNGWHPTAPGAGRTKFNHNAYIQKTNENIEVYRTIFSRGSHNGLQLRPGGVIQDCLFYENALAAFVAMAPSVVEGNVVMRCDDMDSSNPRGNGLSVLPCEHAVVRNNLVLNKIGSAGWAGAIEVDPRTDIIDEPDRFVVEIYDNIIANYPMEPGGRALRNWAGGKADVTMRNNIVHQNSGGPDLPNFADPNRSMDTYVPGGFEAFITEARNRPRGTWDPKFSAASFNAYMRAGFKPQ